MSLTPEEEALEKAIVEFERNSEGYGAIITGWVVIAEFIDTNGDPQLSAYARSGMPYWRIDGLIEAAPTAIVYADWEEIDEDDV